MKLDKEVIKIIITFYRNLLKCEDNNDFRCVLSDLQESLRKSLSNIVIACHQEDFDDFKTIAINLGFKDDYKPISCNLEFNENTYIICYYPAEGTYGTFVDYKDEHKVKMTEWFIYNYNHISNIIVGTNKAINE